MVYKAFPVPSLCNDIATLLSIEYRWTGWFWEITCQSSRLQEKYQSL
jgi:hypothetical protein